MLCVIVLFPDHTHLPFSIVIIEGVVELFSSATGKIQGWSLLCTCIYMYTSYITLIETC